MGSGVTKVKKEIKLSCIGKRVLDKFSAPEYHLFDKKINAGWVTTFNKLAVISENRCTAIPESISNDEASLFGCAVTTVLGLLKIMRNLEWENQLLFWEQGVLV